MGAIVFLFLINNRNNTIDTNTEEENTSVNTTTAGVADYSISLPNGYALGDYQSSLIFYNIEETIICGEVYYTNTTVRDDNKFEVAEIILSNNIGIRY